MATTKMSRMVLATVLIVSLGGGMIGEVAKADSWAASRTTYGDAMATFYGGTDASGTYAGACGYGNPWATGYGVQTAALSDALFNDGLTCGACFKLVCKRSATAYAEKWCYRNAAVYVTATNECPPGSNGGWCDPPNIHFDLAYPAFTRLASEVAGVIPIEYKRIMCDRKGGIKFTISGNAYWNLVLVTNVGGAGDVVHMAMKGSGSSTWYTMSRNWGQNWEAFVKMSGQGLSFRVTTGFGRTVTFWNVAPRNWGFGQTFQSGYNIY